MDYVSGIRNGFMFKQFYLLPIDSVLEQWFAQRTLPAANDDYSMILPINPIFGYYCLLKSDSKGLTIDRVVANGSTISRISTITIPSNPTITCFMTMSADNIMLLGYETIAGGYF